MKLWSICPKSHLIVIHVFFSMIWRCTFMWCIWFFKYIICIPWYWRFLSSCMLILDSEPLDSLKLLRVDSLLTIPLNLQRIIIDDNTCNQDEDREFHVSDFPFLISIDIGNEAGVNVKNVCIENCNNLNTIHIGHWSLNSSNVADGSFIIRNCPALTVIEIGDNSVMSVPVSVFESNAFHYDWWIDLPSLQEMHFGTGVLTGSYDCDGKVTMKGRLWSTHFIKTCLLYQCLIHKVLLSILWKVCTLKVRATFGVQRRCSFITSLGFVRFIPRG